jgi:hypothetical protein
MKIKSRSHVQVVHDGNDEVTGGGEDAFQLDELVYSYQVAPSIELEEDSIFHVTKNTYVHVDLEELNDILSTSKITEVDEDEEIKQLRFNEEDDEKEDDEDF